jgi:hypothetical protein
MGHSERLSKTKHGLGKGIEVLTGHCYVVAPPSNHIDGTVYEYIGGEVHEIPDVLLAVIRDGRPDDHPNDAPIFEGERNNSLASIAGTFFRKGTSLDSVKWKLHEINAMRCKPRLSFDEVDAIAVSI